MIISITEEEFTLAVEDLGGWCISCGEEAYGVEPDAREYKCEACGKRQVYGAEELLLMGQIFFID
jgi:Zn finger protein HypA/HybF involved in hydrogenase expression